MPPDPLPAAQRGPPLPGLDQREHGHQDRGLLGSLIQVQPRLAPPADLLGSPVLPSPATMYVEGLAGPDTINTMPLKTYEALPEAKIEGPVAPVISGP